MPQTVPADELHAMKYRGQGEDFREAMNRVAFGLHDNDRHYHTLREILLDQRFMPAGRIQSAIGSTRMVTAYNCFVSGVIGDSLTTGHGSIMQRASEAAQTMRMGGGIGYDFSTLRPRGELITTLQSHSSGPVSFMRIFNEICLCISSAGHRRGAQMGVMRVDHPDIEEFIRAKQNTTELRGFNLSIGITDEFMECLYAKKEFPLKWGGKIYRMVDAETLWEIVMRGTHDWAEPGVVFIDRMNAWNNLYYAETISTTNPCSEQPLPPFGACLLGSFNLAKYLRRKGISLIDADSALWYFDYDQLRADIPPVVRAMDNVVERSRYPLAEQRAEALTKRRMGLGVAALANAAEALGYAYGEAEFLEFEAKVLALITEQSYLASAALAKEKGSFPLYDAERYLAGKFIQSLPEHVRDAIKVCGIRNSHLTSIAPTGTISLTADNVSSGLEPVWSYSYKRPVNTPNGPVEMEVEDYGVAFLGVRGKLAHRVTANEHIAVLATAQKYVDSAVSKTVNMDGTMGWSDFKRLYTDAYDLGCKSCSTFNSDGKRMGLLVKQEDETAAEGGACTIDFETGVRSCDA